MKAAPHVRANVTNDGVVLLDVKEGSIYTANVVGARIWQLLQNGYAEAEVIEQIVAEYGAPRATVESDFREFTSSLKQRALLAEAQEA
jgi:hypothetical protein